ETARTPAASASLGKAVALHLEGKTDAALKELSLAIDGGENFAELHAAMGHIQFELQRYDDAAKSYLKAAQADLKSKTASYNRGAAGIARKDKAVIKEFSERLFKTLPNSPAAQEGLATVAFANGDFETAGRHCAKLVAAAPHSFEGWFNLGVASQELGRPAEA